MIPYKEKDAIQIVDRSNNREAHKCRWGRYGTAGVDRPLTAGDVRRLADVHDVGTRRFRV